ncbi:acetylxylan esterase [Microbacterium sp. NPDC090218]
MIQFDLPLKELETYSPEIPVPEDFDAFWSATLADANRHDVAVDLVRVITPYRSLETYDVSFSGYAGERIKAWLHLPADASGPLPGIVQFMGYNSGRGLSHQFVSYALAGYAHLVMDNRGMGTFGAVSATADSLLMTTGDGGAFITRGIEDPESYYYRRLFTDAARAVEALRSLDVVDASRVGVSGGSQGGALALAASALADGVKAASIDVPFLCQITRAMRITDTGPFSALGVYLNSNRDKVTRVENTLSYFDAATMGARATAAGLFSVGLMDAICPPSSVFAAYNRFGGPREIRVYEFNGHEGGQEHHQLESFAWFGRHLQAAG